MNPGDVGVCGVRTYGRKGRTKVSGRCAYLDWYYDPLPTNCVAEWVCGERGPGVNLAVFFGGCSFNCLFCQNWHHRKLVGDRRFLHSPEDLASLIREDVRCVCYFGGDPTPYMDFVINASRRILKVKKVRLCLETNGSVNWKLLKSFLELSLKTGGVVKIDVKAFNERLHMALTGSSNRNTLDNLEKGILFSKENGGPMVVASTLLVPGYVDAEEVRKIAELIASLDKNTPYSLLAFHPQYMMDDIPPTPRSLAEECYRAALDAGLRRVKVGNVHLLW